MNEDDVDTEGWRAGYASAVEQVRIGAQMLGGSHGLALDGMADVLEVQRDEAERRYVALAEQR